ncbi:helix-turn-helix domain-containing protein [Pseudonocardia nematodicida]|uniref:Helix-turn-helix domain-containing protein n=1 Tax=Pseudonocardia nematodicida TaxID=1206997 RepID=A0ABV1KGP8_9PSEU
MPTPPRQRVLDAARALFLDRGFVDTTIGDIAREAGVALKTIYSGYGSKVGILTALQDRDVAGDGDAVALLDRDWATELPTLSRAEAVRRTVGQLAVSTERAAPVLAVVASAASDPAVGELLERLHAQRVETCRELARRIDADRRDELADLLYALLGVETHQLLVVRRGWSRAAWERFAEQSITTLLDDDADRLRS